MSKLEAVQDPVDLIPFLLEAVNKRCGSNVDSLKAAKGVILEESKDVAMASSVAACLETADRTMDKGLLAASVMWTSNALGYLGGYDWIDVNHKAKKLASQR